MDVHVHVVGWMAGWMARTVLWIAGAAPKIRQETGVLFISRRVEWGLVQALPPERMLLVCRTSCTWALDASLGALIGPAGRRQVGLPSMAVYYVNGAEYCGTYFRTRKRNSGVQQVQLLLCT